MNDLDPAKMTETERRTLFASFTKDVTPAEPTRKTIAAQIAPWRGSIRADRARGLDWKQLAEVLAKNLKINVTPKSLERIMRDTSHRKKHGTRKSQTGASAETTAAPANRAVSA